MTTTTKRIWTAAEMERWTKEDACALILSPLTFIWWMLGVVGSLLMMWWGFLCLVLAAVGTWGLFHIIGPKLEAESEFYDQKQKKYIQMIEEKQEWHREETIEEAMKKGKKRTKGGRR